MVDAHAGEFDVLNAQQIIDETCAIIFDSGFSAVSMRQIAARLNVTSAAIYYHFRNKADLLDRVAETIMRGIAATESGRPWQERLRCFVLAAHQAMVDYPGLNRHMVNNRNSRAALWWTESILGILKDAGIPDDVVRPAFALLIFFIDPMTLVDDKSHHGEVIQNTNNLKPDATLDVPEFTNTANFLAGADARTYQAEYALALDRIIAAIERDIPA